jgi:hypothetical protein
VTGELRLAKIVTDLESVGIICLVMGGHAVRYYGLCRNTNDFDLHLAPETWDDLSARVARSPLFMGKEVLEGPSWRPHSFRRFQIGTLPDGREEWLEFWCGNHLLSPFPELYARREEGPYGGRTLSFLSLPDLIRSKETERDSDWQDVAVLEEFLDARLFSRVESGSMAAPEALSSIRSRRGFETALRKDLLADSRVPEQALAATRLSITQAFLLPYAPDMTELHTTTPAIEPVILGKLRTVVPASPLHLALVEVVRRQYRSAGKAADKADKEVIRKGQGGEKMRPTRDETSTKTG